MQLFGMCGKYTSDRTKLASLAQAGIRGTISLIVSEVMSPAQSVVQHRNRVQVKA